MMKRPHKPDENELLAFLDEELSPQRQAEIRQQLAADWELRANLAKLERRVEQFVDATAHVREVDEPLPLDDLWRDFSARLEATSVRPAWQARVAGWWQTEFRLRVLIGATACLLVVAALSFLLWQSERPVSAQEFLQRSTQAEAASLQRVGAPVVYRKIQVKRSGTNESATWESWHDVERTQFRQRLADVKKKPALLAEVEAILTANQFDPQRPLSAAAFAAWRNRIPRQAESVARNNDGLMLTTTATAPHAVNTIIAATLTVRRSDWHAIALQLQVQGERESRSFELRETSFEILSAQALNDFAEATPALSVLANPSPSPSLEPTASPSASPSASTTAALAAIASATLEVEVLERLNQVNALLGEQLNVTRTANGQLKIDGLVETDARKSELLRALQAVASNPAVKIEISTVTEAQTRQAQSSSPRKVIVQDAQVAQQAIPVETELRNHFTARGLTGERLEQEIQRFAAQVCNRSSRARAHALALKQIADRFSAAQLQTQDQATRERWQALLHQHAQGFRREWQQLRQQLQPIFPVATETNTSTSKLNSDEELLNAISRLFKLAATNDAALCQSFSVSTEAAAGAAVKRAEFWRTVSTTETLATQIVAWQ
ncbi:MAG: hypothetical protein JNM09_01910 [Blastocatellia bacterium]|nr:hypothetical protein [Blastocatellia bacterium]